MSVIYYNIAYQGKIFLLIILMLHNMNCKFITIC